MTIAVCLGCKATKQQQQLNHVIDLPSTLVVWKSKGPSETLRDIRTSTYQMCSIEENTIGTTKFHK